MSEFIKNMNEINYVTEQYFFVLTKLFLIIIGLLLTYFIFSQNWKIYLEIKHYDFWIGCYWDEKNKTWYLFFFPCVGFKVKKVGGNQ